jgi:hypothetical protein
MLLCTTVKKMWLYLSYTPTKSRAVAYLQFYFGSVLKYQLGQTTFYYTDSNMIYTAETLLVPSYPKFILTTKFWQNKKTFYLRYPRHFLLGKVELINSHLNTALTKLHPMPQLSGLLLKCICLSCISRMDEYLLN